MEFPSSGNMVGDMDMKSPNLQYQVLYILLMGWLYATYHLLPELRVGGGFNPFEKY